ncbi:hypothetical protein [uncultured Bacteroides sp.]|uniref:hypothetical protein n=1 Tax=uncultured Bacteroides sp. TaxID=162156 RepID=UPI002610130E|nr:hypothetical protein [uncultured Bacteroides sp.]
MSVTVLCDNEYCAYNRNGDCGKEVISHRRKTFSGFRDGEREWGQVCEDYKEIGEYDGAD